MPTRLRTVARFGLLLMFAILLLVAALSLSQQFPAGQDWTHYVRIGAYGLKTDNAEEIVRNAQESNVFGIEVDNDIEGRKAEIKAQIDKFLRDHPRGKEGRVVYNLKRDFGVTADEVRARFKFYFDAFPDVKAEVD